MKLFSWFKKRKDAAPNSQRLLEQQHRRHMAKNHRAFQAAQNTDLTYSWQSQPLPIDQEIRQSLSTLRARSREQAQNNDYMKRFLRLAIRNVIGPNGFSFQVHTKRKNGQPDKPANDAIEKALKEFFKKPLMNGRGSFRAACSTVLRTVLTDGEILVRKVRSGMAPNRFRLGLQLIDAQTLDVNYFRDLDNGNTIRMGIEYNQWDQAVYYHFHQPVKNEQAYTYRGKHYLRIPAKDVLHVYIAEIVDQHRGLPEGTTAMWRMKQLHGYEDAAVIAARIGAAKMGFFSSKGGEAYTGSEYETAGDEDSAPIIDAASPGTFEDIGDRTFHSFDPDYPHQQFGDFVKATLRGISSGLDVSYNAISNDLEGVNYSSIRAGVLEDREAWKTLQAFMIEEFCLPVYEWWLDSVLANRVAVFESGATLNPELKEKYMDITVQGRRWSWVDPQKDMAANEKAIELGLRSRSEIIREMGRDPDEVWLEIQKERERLKELGIENEPATAGFLMPEENEGDDDE